MAKVDRVTEVCNVTSEEAHRVLADCEMDVQRAIERFVSGTCRCPGRSLAWLGCASSLCDAGRVHLG